MKNKNTLTIAAITFFALVLLLGIYLNALSHRYTVLSGDDLLVMDNWTKKTYILKEPINLQLTALRQTQDPLALIKANAKKHKEYNKLNALYQSLKANPSIKGLPDTFEEFKNTLLE